MAAFQGFLRTLASAWLPEIFPVSAVVCDPQVTAPGGASLVVAGPGLSVIYIKKDMAI